MAMMMTGRVLLVCALCVLWCGAGGIHARNPDNNSLGGYMASRGFGRNKSFLSNGSIKNLSTPLLLSASFISAMQAEAHEEVPSAGVTDSPLSGGTGLSPAFSGPDTAIARPTVPGHVPGAAIPVADFSARVPAFSGLGSAGPVHGPVSGADAIPVAAVHGHGAGPGHGAAAFSGLGAAGPGAIPGPAPVRGPTFSVPDANIFGAPVPGNGPAAIPGAPVSGHVPGAIPGAPVPGNGPAAIPGAPVSGHVPGAIPGAPVPGNGPAAIPGAPVSSHGPGAAAFSGLGAAIHGAADPGAAIHGAIPGPGSVRGAAVHVPVGPDHGPALSGLVPAVPGAGHSVGGGSEPPDSRSVVISSSQGGNGKTAPVSVSSDEQIASPEEVLPQKETGSQGTSSPEGQPTVSSNTEKQRNNSASAGGHSLGHDAAGDELQDSLEEQQKNDHSQTNETKKSSGDQITESQRSGGALSKVSNTTTHGIKTQLPKTNSANEKNYSQNTDASHTTSPLLLLVVVACAAAVVAA
ncbi:Mucin-associated surface protein (MASP) [Trypanosoma cruzi]|uniref:Mucin-associated surface protein (MASP), putative n=2 Tax=Trypanosoma cruzi TaxID=5693 RepID=Q4DVJ9_TRYCC|nr:mucin-associated surface protein (MASP), putative [Trypanosoma cruzi]EAN96556.1 mucin-associated surface protein (MASP), putative [Trypanosoma cruzi]PWV20797.1 Mucin-associated surface protein (MASP) [Trypanosoma cruzi]|eukprot:XP_818407.1 mucin-associated surface protein (MASP) [Trypanosoma cruzi strain CL Brener]